MVYCTNSHEIESDNNPTHLHLVLLHCLTVLKAGSGCSIMDIVQWPRPTVGNWQITVLQVWTAEGQKRLPKFLESINYFGKYKFVDNNMFEHLPYHFFQYFTSNCMTDLSSYWLVSREVFFWTLIKIFKNIQTPPKITCQPWIWRGAVDQE